MLKTIAATALLATIAAAAPGCDLVPGWTQSGPARSYTPDNLFEYMDGNTEGYILSNFQEMHGVTCKKSTVPSCSTSPTWAAPIPRTASSRPIAICASRRMQ